jgi:hypothetical protein
MDATQRSGLRRAAGLALLAAVGLVLILCVVIAGTPPPCCGENLNPAGGLAVAVVAGVPTLLAAVAVLAGGSVGGIFGSIVSILFGAVAVGLLTTNEPGVVAVAVGLTLAYWFAGIASLLTIHARDKPRVSTDP